MVTDGEPLLSALKRISAARTLAGFGAAVARELFVLVPGISTSYNELNPAVPKAFAFIHPEPAPDWWETFTAPFESRMGEHPVLRAFAEQGDGPPTTWTDVDPDGAFRQTRLYQDFYAPNGIHSQLVFQVPASLGVVVGVSVNRDGSPFTAEERALVGELRAHLVNLHHLVTLADRARLSVELLGLTPRQAEVAMLLQEGLTTDQIARRLGISAGTVRKHLDAVFQVLGVQSRAAAVARLLTAGPGPNR